MYNNCLFNICLIITFVAAQECRVSVFHICYSSCCASVLRSHISHLLLYSCCTGVPRVRIFPICYCSCCAGMPHVRIFPICYCSCCVGVPRVWEKIEEKIREAGKTTTGIKRTIADWAKGGMGRHLKGLPSQRFRI